jgi:hypothetical protein
MPKPTSSAIPPKERPDLTERMKNVSKQRLTPPPRREHVDPVYEGHKRKD